MPPRSPHKREQVPGLHYQPVSTVSNSNNNYNLGSDSDVSDIVFLSSSSYIPLFYFIYVGVVCVG